MNLKKLRDFLNALPDSELEKPAIVSDILQETFTQILSIQMTRLTNPLIENQYVLVAGLNK